MFGPGVPHWLLVGILEFQYLFMASAWKVDCSVSWIVSLAGYRVGMFAVLRVVPSRSGRLSILRLFLPDSVPVGCFLSLSFLLPLPSPPWVVCPCSAPLVLPSVVPFVKIDCLGCILFSLISSCVLVGQFLGLSHGFIPRSGGFGGACLALD